MIVASYERVQLAKELSSICDKARKFDQPYLIIHRTWRTFADNEFALAKAEKSENLMRQNWFLLEEGREGKAWTPLQLLAKGVTDP